MSNNFFTDHTPTTTKIKISDVDSFIKEAQGKGFNPSAEDEKPNRAGGTRRYLQNFYAHKCGWETISIGSPWSPLPENGEVEVSRHYHDGE